jgi:hypothetical protein
LKTSFYPWQHVTGENQSKYQIILDRISGRPLSIPFLLMKSLSKKTDNNKEKFPCIFASI